MKKAATATNYIKENHGGFITTECNNSLVTGSRLHNQCKKEQNSVPKIPCHLEMCEYPPSDYEELFC